VKALLVHTRNAVTAVAVAGLTGCSMAPSYKPPAAPEVASYKEAAPQDSVSAGDWAPANPADTQARGPWWAPFADAELDRLERDAVAANQDLAAAAARYRQARAAADEAGSQLFPTVGLAGAVERARESANAPNNTTRVAHTANDYVLRAQTSYELDFWGRVRNTAAAARARFQAGAADLQTALLSVQSELAMDYIMLRGLDAQKDLLDTTVAAYERAAQIVERRYKAGAAAVIDLDQANTQLDTARAQLANTILARAQMEHAIAVLVAKPASLFTLAPAPLNMTVPKIDTGLPSQLLERRPDVAAAERRMYAANAEVGVARAAWFPTFSLDAGIGYEGNHSGNWIQAPSQIWSFGPTMMLDLLDWGRRSAQNRGAKAAMTKPWPTIARRSCRPSATSKISSPPSIGWTSSLRRKSARWAQASICWIKRTTATKVVS
jgi:NodT family efflux transporter outer membrane factor (OMF) lipoprotein